MLGPETSIIRVAGAGFRLSLLLNAAACQLAQSRIEIHSIAKGISLFALTLKQLGQALESPDLARTTEATEKAWEIASQGQLVFVEIEHMLDKLQGTDAHEDLSRIPVQERLKWCFRKQHVTYLLAQLESLKLSLIVMTRILQLGDLLKSGKEGANSSNCGLVAEDIIAQEKAETQNMIIVRYWSLKRLDRLWDFVAQEAVDAANDPTNQKIISNHSSATASAMGPLVTAAKGSDLSKLPVVTFGDSDVGLANLERSPKDMVHLSEGAMNRLLLAWIPSLDLSLLSAARKPSPDATKPSQPRAYVSSGSEDDDSDDPDWDGHSSHGYYLEGTTDDWRKPHSQEARKHAAELRRRYSSYQAHVENDSETDELKQRRQTRPKNPRITDSSDEGEQRSTSRPPPKSVTINDNRVHSNSSSSRYPPSPVSDRGPPAYPNGSFQPPPPTQSIPRSQGPPQSKPMPIHIPGPPQQPYRYHPNQEFSNTAPRSIPNSQPNVPAGSMPIPSPRATPPGQFDASWARQQQNYNNNHLQPRPHPSAYPLSSSSPESSFSLRPSPPRSAQRSPTRSHRRSSREEAKERHKALTRSATRGLAGIGAIAGFMDALEAFTLL
ncbi:uncharacterized protein N7496_009781 [Penicillium cataractarum]|uniref:Fungal N-terminal domain-containing protein n=1 Tax=Penicillium cataractarum TaxID=2100454 RepID=A0A9W9RPK8_9EURO|nr:uncharacterized protein N7496_009781 [Penicillium cataractarum]KAJ5364068.1 hypothetical protein N7496_009781 [Penicillium cataractarum]